MKWKGVLVELLVNQGSLATWCLRSVLDSDFWYYNHVVDKANIVIYDYEWISPQSTVLLRYSLSLA